MSDGITSLKVRDITKVYELGSVEVPALRGVSFDVKAREYLALMGPQGMADIGEGIMLRSRYAMQQLDRIRGVRAPLFRAPHFKEFVVNFDGTGQSVAHINQALLERGIFGGLEDRSQFMIV